MSRTSADAVPRSASRPEWQEPEVTEKSESQTCACHCHQLAARGVTWKAILGGVFAANVPKKPYMKTDLVIKRLKALETGTWFRQSNIPTGAQYS